LQASSESESEVVEAVEAEEEVHTEEGALSTPDRLSTDSPTSLSSSLQ
jgi:hypothetical protein